jgi:hypothetical protein
MEDEMERCGDDRGGKGKGKGKAKQGGGGIDEGAMMGNEDYEESEEKYLLKFQEYLERNPEHVFRFVHPDRSRVGEAVVLIVLCACVRACVLWLRAVEQILLLGPALVDVKGLSSDRALLPALWS